MGGTEPVNEIAPYRQPPTSVSAPTIPVPARSCDAHAHIIGPGDTFSMRLTAARYYRINRFQHISICRHASVASVESKVHAPCALCHSCGKKII
jgi:hypothetical protein